MRRRRPTRWPTEGFDLGVINARFVKPLDTDDDPPAVRECPFVVTVEEGALMGGFGSAVLEAASDAGLEAGRIRRLGVPDRFIEHGDRSELLAELGLDAAGHRRRPAANWPADRAASGSRRRSLPSPDAAPA